MNFKLSSATVGLLLAAAALSSSAFAADQCRDANGKFIKCPTTQHTSAAKCRNIETKKFAKCGTPGTEPVPTATADSSATSGKCRNIETKQFAKCGEPGTEPVPKTSSNVN